MKNTSRSGYVWMSMVGLAAIVAIWLAWHVGVSVGKHDTTERYRMEMVLQERVALQEKAQDDFGWSIERFSDIEGYQDLRNFQKGDELRDMSDGMGHGPNLVAQISDNIAIDGYLFPYAEIPVESGLRYEINGYAPGAAFSNGIITMSIRTHNGIEQVQVDQFQAYARSSTNTDEIIQWVAHPENRPLEKGQYKMEFIGYKNNTRQDLGNMLFEVVE